MFKELNIMKIFLEEPTREFNVREVARILKISPATASKKLKNLMEKELLKERKERLYNLYKADIENEYYKDVKIFYNVRKIKNYGLVNSLNKFYLMPNIILFGSCAWGMDTKDSDMDLLIISEKKKEFPYLKKFEKRLNRRLHLFIVQN
ncbi:MAG: nucleotidyltransferase domain-containing protein, partial [Nanoarchaeota archaeon]|nr:nucleotidyltransferase domain-containing protein [Nanoarchaeota archaeon]